MIFRQFRPPCSSIHRELTIAAWYNHTDQYPSGGRPTKPLTPSFLCVSLQTFSSRSLLSSLLGPRQTVESISGISALADECFCVLGHFYVVATTVSLSGQLVRIRFRSLFSAKKNSLQESLSTIVLYGLYGQRSLTHASSFIIRIHNHGHDHWYSWYSLSAIFTLGTIHPRHYPPAAISTNEYRRERANWDASERDLLPNLLLNCSEFI